MNHTRWPAFNHRAGESTKPKGATSRFARFLAIALFCGSLLGLPTTVVAQVNATWLGGNGQWNVKGNWDIGAVPGNSGPTTYNVFIDGAKNDNAVVTMPAGFDTTISNLTVDSGNTLNLSNDVGLTIAGGSGAGTIDDSGTITLESSGITSIVLSGASSSFTLSGGGILSMVPLGSNSLNEIVGTGSESLTNSLGNTIQGSGRLGSGVSIQKFMLTNNGTINANQPTVGMNIDPGNGVTNTGILEATSGGTLSLADTYTNAGGAIEAIGAGSVVNLGNSTINGGTLTTANGGVINNNTGVTLNGVTLSSGTTVTDLDSSATFEGTITLGSNATFTMTGHLNLSGAVILAGGGALSVTSSLGTLVEGSGSTSLTNNLGNTIEGAGQFGIGASAPFALINNGTINANQTGGTLAVNPGGAITGTGIMEATGAGTLTIIVPFTNNGTAQATGGGTFNITGAFTNAGQVVVGANSTFNAGYQSEQNPYVQTAGATELTDPTSLFEDIGQNIDINGGTLKGVGTIKANLLQIAGVLQVGDAPGVLAETGKYSQTAAGTLEIAIGGADPGAMGYSQLNISSTAALAGTLDLSLFDGFTPFNGETFTILTSRGLSGTTFSTIDGAVEGNVTFNVSYTSDDVLLTAAVAAPEPSTFLLLAIALAGIAMFSTRRRKRCSAARSSHGRLRLN